MPANGFGLLIDVVVAAAAVVSAVAAVAAVTWAKRAHAAAESAKWVAKEANRLAKDANEIATSANGYASKSNEIARSAVDQAKEAELRLLWNEAILALENIRLVDLDKTDLEPGFTNLNGRLSLLADALNPNHEWPMIYEWLTDEMQVGMTLAYSARHSLGEAAASSAELPPDVIGALHHPFRNWGSRLNVQSTVAESTGLS